MEDTELPERQACRVIAIDPAGRVLLFRYENPPPKGLHWATPGGGLEAGEDFYAAACRELAEETGWADVPVARGGARPGADDGIRRPSSSVSTTGSSSRGCWSSDARSTTWPRCTSATGSTTRAGGRSPNLTEARKTVRAESSRT